MLRENSYKLSKALPGFHLLDNKSDHSPIYCVLDTKILQQEDDPPVRLKPVPSWRRASHEQKVDYKHILEEKLGEIIFCNEVSMCKNLSCKDPRHREELDTFTLNILGTVQDVAEQTLPIPPPGRGCKPGKAIPGWREEVKPFRDQAYFWHQLWQSCGRPLNNEVHRIMKTTRNRYHYEYKKCLKIEEKIRKNKLLNSCINMGGNIFTELKAIRKSVPIIASKMDGNQDVKGVFKDKYEALYNSANDEEALMKVLQEVESRVTEASLIEVEKVTPSLVKEAAKKLKPGKSDPMLSFTSDCFKNAGDVLYEKLCKAIQSFLVHGHVTMVLLLATLVPIIKDKLGSISAIKNKIKLL